MNPPPAIPWTEHPIVGQLAPPLPEEEIRRTLTKPNGYEMVLQYWEERERWIKQAEEDPLQSGFELPFWQDLRDLLARKDHLYALGGNGPGKTEIGGKLAVEMMCREKSRKILCVATNENSSRQLQQPAVYKYLPATLRNQNERPGPQRRDHITKIRYSPAGGFTEGTFVLPNRSQCWFKTVRQYMDDPTSFEGPEYDLVWIDEPAPLKMLQTLAFRVAKRAGKVFFTFTAVHGYDAVCNETLTGARLVKSLPMNFQWDLRGDPKRPEGKPDPDIKIPELRPDEIQVKGCPPGHMPYIMQPLNPAHGVIFLWTHWNLFTKRSPSNPKVPKLLEEAAGKAPQVVRMRLFGWTDKVSGSPFPKLDPLLHIVPAEKIPPTSAGTDFMSADPATARSYFLLWVRVDANGTKWIFDESPRVTEGEWVSSDGEKGEGASVFAGRGINWYKAHIRRRELEHGQAAIRRKGDPRAFATEAQNKDGAESLFDLFNKDGDKADEYTRAMYFEPAKVRARVDLDLEKVNDEIGCYDETQPIWAENQPRLFISDRCQNLIRAMFNWSLEQPSDSPWKDPVDALRYLFDEPLYYVNPNVPEVVGGRGW